MERENGGGRVETHRGRERESEISVRDQHVMTIYRSERSGWSWVQDLDSPAWGWAQATRHCFWSHFPVTGPSHALSAREKVCSQGYSPREQKSSGCGEICWLAVSSLAITLYFRKLCKWLPLEPLQNWVQSQDTEIHGLQNFTTATTEYEKEERKNDVLGISHMTYTNDRLTFLRNLTSKALFAWS